MKPIYFDLTVTDPKAARRFFETALGWSFERFPMPYEYYRITAGPADEAGIDGGMGCLSDARDLTDRPMVSLIMPVDDLERTIDTIRSCGGSVIEEPTPIPGVGWMATCAAPGGLKFGLLQSDPNTNSRQLQPGESA
jgi:predicted enzyme related to lactoylglutathione lyase